MTAAPLGLSDAQLDIVFRLAAPLHNADRDGYLRDVAEKLGGMTDIGDGIVMRICVEVQRRYWKAPQFAGVQGKYW